MSFGTSAKVIIGMIKGNKDAQAQADAWLSRVPPRVRVGVPQVFLQSGITLFDASRGHWRMALLFGTAAVGWAVIASPNSVRKEVFTPVYVGGRIIGLTAQTVAIGIKQAFRLAGTSVLGGLAAVSGYASISSLMAGTESGRTDLGVAGFAIMATIGCGLGHSAVEYFKGLPRSSDPINWGTVRGDLTKIGKKLSRLTADIHSFRDRIENPERPDAGNSINAGPSAKPC